MKLVRFATLLVLTLAACSSDDDDDTVDPPVGAVTYWKDVKPILDAKCSGCHFEGGIAPMELKTYAQAFEFSGMIKTEVEAERMPPWPPNNECATYTGNRSLTPEQIATIKAWADGGAIEGDAAQQGAALPDTAPRLSREDLTLEMAEPYVPAVSPDDYRCFVIPWPSEYTTTKYMTGFRADPGTAKIVHHIIAYTADAGAAAEYAALDDAEAGPGYTCFGGPGGVPSGSLGGWAPGSMGQDLPAGTGIAVAPGTLVILQVHYNTLNFDPEVDLSSITMKLDDSVDVVVDTGAWLNPSWFQGQMAIPANQADVEHSFEWDADFYLNGEPMTIYNATLHMHTRGTRAKLSIERADGSSDCLLQIDDWNFHWQGSYQLATPKTVMPGDRLRVECHWDNTAENQPIGADGQPLPVQDVNWGEGTTDEMCISFFLKD